MSPTSCQTAPPRARGLLSQVNLSGSNHIPADINESLIGRSSHRFQPPQLPGPIFLFSAASGSHPWRNLVSSNLVSSNLVSSANKITFYFLMRASAQSAKPNSGSICIDRDRRQSCSLILILAVFNPENMSIYRAHTGFLAGYIPDDPRHYQSSSARG